MTLLCLWDILDYAVAQNHERWKRQVVPPELPPITGADLHEAIVSSEDSINRRLNNVQSAIFNAGKKEPSFQYPSPTLPAAKFLPVRHSV